EHARQNGKRGVQLDGNGRLAVELPRDGRKSAVQLTGGGCRTGEAARQGGERRGEGSRGLSLAGELAGQARERAVKLAGDRLDRLRFKIDIVDPHRDEPIIRGPDDEPKQSAGGVRWTRRLISDLGPRVRGEHHRGSLYVLIQEIVVSIVPIDADETLPVTAGGVRPKPGGEFSVRLDRVQIDRVYQESLELEIDPEGP